MTPEKTRYHEQLQLLGIAPSLIEARGLRPCYEAKQLERVEIGNDGKEHRLTPASAAAWRLMKAARLQCGVQLFIICAYRSVDRQIEIIQHKLAAGHDIEDILCVSAPPGFSEHHTGCAVDLCAPGTVPLDPGFDQTPAFDWLQQRAGRFGYTLSYPVGNCYGYQYEPWHWCHGSVGLNL